MKPERIQRNPDKPVEPSDKAVPKPTDPSGDAPRQGEATPPGGAGEQPEQDPNE